MEPIKFFTNVFRLKSWMILIMFVSGSAILFSCSNNDEIIESENTDEEPFENPTMTMDKTLSDNAQEKTIAFDALGFMSCNFGGLTFLPPGKVADYCGFQYFRDNDQTNMGHNNEFVSIISNNILNILIDAQIQMFVDGAQDQITLIRKYADMRLPLCKAFQRLLVGDLPDGTTGLDEEAIKAYSAELYKIDEEISYGRAELFGRVINSLTDAQKNQIVALKNLKGVGNWDRSLKDPSKDMGLEADVRVTVSTYASEIYTWYAGSITGDVYFCPERQATYFGSFYLKDGTLMRA